MAAFLSCLETGIQTASADFHLTKKIKRLLNALHNTHTHTGLLPHGQLDPPLWSQRGIGGKIFPWQPKVRRRPLPSVLESGEDLPIDYVFRIVNKSNHKEFREFLSIFPMSTIRNKLNSVASHPILETGRTSPRRTHLSSSSTNESSDGSSKSMSLDQSLPDSPHVVYPFYCCFPYFVAIDGIV